MHLATRAVPLTSVRRHGSSIAAVAALEPNEWIFESLVIRGVLVCRRHDRQNMRRAQWSFRIYSQEERGVLTQIRAFMPSLRATCNVSAPPPHRGGSQVASLRVRPAALSTAGLTSYETRGVSRAWRILPARDPAQCSVRRCLSGQPRCPRRTAGRRWCSLRPRRVGRRSRPG